MTESINYFDLNMEIMVLVLGTIFFWLGTGLSIVMFREKAHNEHSGLITLDKFSVIFTFLNVFMTIILIAIHDFRVTLFSTVVLFCVYSIGIRILYRKILLAEHRKEREKRKMLYKYKQRKYF